MYENLAVNQETKRLAGENNQLQVAAIYPKEGTFWANHPYAILNTPWVTDEMRDAAEIFQSFLLDKPQQQKAIELGFRPSDPSIVLSTPLDSQHGVDIQQPKTVLEIPTPEVIRQTQDLWKQTKKPVDLVIAIDVSASMSGDKIAAARTSLVQFINLLNDQDRLEVITFSSKVTTMTPISELGPQRTDVTRRVSGIIETGKTSLYDAVSAAYDSLEKDGDPKHIRAVVVLSDGNDTASQLTLQEVMDQIGKNADEEGGNSVKLFTIAYGSDADTNVLKQMTESTGGRQYDSKPETINQIYGEIATFF